MSSTVTLVSMRDLQVSSTSGHAVAFKAGEPRAVPEHLAAECRGLGCLAPEEARAALAMLGGKPVDTSTLADNDLPPPRDEVIRNAVEALVARNDAGDFTTNGRPRKPVLERLVGFPLSSDELDSAYQQVMALKTTVVE